MANYFVASGGSNTSPYDTWAKAATSLQTALTAASANGDQVIIQYDAVPSGDAELAADTSYAPVASRDISIISASNDGGSDFTPTPMGTANWIGNSTTNRTINFGSSADNRLYCYGLTLRTSGTTADNIVLASGGGTAMVFDSGYLWAGNTGSVNSISSGNNSGGFNDVLVKNTTLRFGAAGNTITTIPGAGRMRFDNCTVSSAGTAPTNLCSNGNLTFVGCDLSFVTSNLVGNNSSSASFIFQQCKLGAGVSKMAPQTSNPTASSARVWVIDCSDGDTHGLFGYYDALGSVESDTGIMFTGSAAGQSWKIVTTANASPGNPFYTPWISFYHSGTSAITPRFEVLRDGSSTAYTDAELSAEFAAKVTSGSTLVTFYSDRQVTSAWLIGTAGTSQDSGSDTWDGENATHWAGKLDSGSPITPAEAGDIRGRVVVCAPSITLYADPYIRT